MSVLIADIGATYARFAVSDVEAMQVSPSTMMVAGIATLEDALTQFLESKNLSASDLAGAVFCAAGPVREDGSIHMTNCPWFVSPQEISKTHPVPFVRVLNDMSAAALGLLRIGPGDVEPIGGGNADPKGPKAILAPGTGLGVSGLIPCAGGGWSALASEGGHVDLAPHNEREIAIVFHLLRQFGHVSPERILSGPGLETLYQALLALDGTSDTSNLAAVDIAAAARRSEPQASEAITLFSGWLGSVAGDLALTLGASGGVYIGGGIVPKWPDLFDHALFRRRFEAKGRFDNFLKSIPTYIVARGDLALLGCLEKAKASFG